MATIFTRIAKGEIPSYKCAESDDFYAFLDISPLAPGHTLVIPKHVEDDYIFHLDEKTYEGLWAFARKVALAVKAAVPCKRVGVAVLGMEVPHTHIHLVPLQTEGDLDFRKQKPVVSEDEMKRIAASILKEYENLYDSASGRCRPPRRRVRQAVGKHRRHAYRCTRQSGHRPAS